MCRSVRMTKVKFEKVSSRPKNNPLARVQTNLNWQPQNACWVYATKYYNSLFYLWNFEGVQLCQAEPHWFTVYLQRVVSSSKHFYYISELMNGWQYVTNYYRTCCEGCNILHVTGTTGWLKKKTITSEKERMKGNKGNLKYCTATGYLHICCTWSSNVWHIQHLKVGQFSRHTSGTWLLSRSPEMKHQEHHQPHHTTKHKWCYVC